MALLSDYTAGSISIEANSTEVAGQGSAWLTAGFREGDVLYANGFSGIVASVSANGALTLDQPWRGGALNAAHYRLRYQGDGSRFSAQARQLIEALGVNGNPQAFAALVGGANQLPFFTGPGTMALTGLTAFMRQLLDDVDQATARQTLGAASKAGERFTGPIDIDGAQNTTPYLALLAGSLRRWLIVRENQAESGTANGSRLGIQSYDNAGGYYRTPLQMDREGAIYTPHNPLCRVAPSGAAATLFQDTITGLVPGDGSFIVNRGGFYIGGNLNGQFALHVPKTGAYKVTFKLFVNSANTDRRIALQRNGSADFCMLKPQPSPNGGASIESATSVVNLSAGDYLSMVSRFAATSVYLAPDHSEVTVEFLG